MNDLTYREAGVVADQMSVPPELDGSPNRLLIRLANLMRALDAYASFGFAVENSLATEVPMRPNRMWQYVRAMEGRLIEQIDSNNGVPIYRYIGETDWPVPSPIRPYSTFSFRQLTEAKETVR